MSNYREELIKAFKAVHDCAADFLLTMPVIEKFGEQIVWEGDVECFKLHGHPKAKLGYAWGYKADDGEWEITTVLDIPPIDSAQGAVKAAIVAHAKQQTPPQSHKTS